MNDHFVLGHNGVSRKLIEDWAKANKVEVAIDYLPPAGEKIYLLGRVDGGGADGGAPSLIVYVFLMDYYASGLTAGATKG